MGFGEAYQGMELREIVIEMATKMDIMIQQQASDAIHREKLEQKVDSIRCPSPRCHDHDNRISNLEHAEECRQDSWGPRTAWAIVGLTVISVVISVIALIGV